MRKRSRNDVEKALNALDGKSSIDNLYDAMALKSTEMLYRNIENISIHHKFLTSPYHVRNIPLSYRDKDKSFLAAHCSYCHKRHISESVYKNGVDYSDWYEVVPDIVQNDKDVIFLRRYIPNMLYCVEKDEYPLFDDFFLCMEMIRGFFYGDRHSPSWNPVYNKYNKLDKFKNDFIHDHMYKKDNQIFHYSREIGFAKNKYENCIIDHDDEHEMFNIMYVKLRDRLFDYKREFTINGLSSGSPEAKIIENERNNSRIKFPRYRISGCMCKNCFFSMIHYFQMLNIPDSYSNPDCNKLREMNYSRCSFLGNDLKANSHMSKEKTIYCVISDLLDIGCAILYSHGKKQHTDYQSYYGHLAPLNIHDYSFCTNSLVLLNILHGYMGLFLENSDRAIDAIIQGSISKEKINFMYRK